MENNSKDILDYNNKYLFDMYKRKKERDVFDITRCSTVSLVIVLRSGTDLVFFQKFR